MSANSPLLPAEPVAPAVDQAKLALERTFLAHERTLMAWNRTATSMITFGFALYKFFFFLHEGKPPTEMQQVFGARTYGVIIMAVGVLVLVLATVQHQQQMKILRRMYPEAPMSLSLLLGTIMSAVGVVAFVIGLFRL